MSKRKKILIAAGGTGGHLFPAQALAQELLEERNGYEILFAGAGLSSSRYFYREKFSFKEVLSDSPFKKGRRLRSLFALFKGVRQSFHLIRKYQPDLVVGFGSFHAFPILMAAFLKKVPFVLFESNSEPGKVNWMFSRWAKISAVQFLEAKKRLRGSVSEVKMPVWRKDKEKKLNVEEARAYFELDPLKLTFLVFGGSQGAAVINNVFSATSILLKEELTFFQIIHIAGNAKNAEELRLIYNQLGICACVKDFEDQMDYAWTAADLVICRAGAATIAEQIDFEVPAVFIPYPHATDQHQTKNAEFIETQVGGGIHLPQSRLDAHELFRILKGLTEQNKLEQMRCKIRDFKNEKNKKSLSDLIFQVIEQME